MQLTKVAELGNFIRDQRRNARLSLRKLSGMAGISNPYLSQIERGLRRPSAEILQAIAKALRISAETLYVKAGILEERGDSTDPVTSILRDLSLSDKQKQALVEIYQSFQHENARDDHAPARAVALARPVTPKTRRAKPAQRKPAARKPAQRKPAARKPAARKKVARKRTAAAAGRKKTTRSTSRTPKAKRRTAARPAKRTTRKKR